MFRFSDGWSKGSRRASSITAAFVVLGMSLVSHAAEGDAQTIENCQKQASDAVGLSEEARNRVYQDCLQTLRDRTLVRATMGVAGSEKQVAAARRAAEAEVGIAQIDRALVSSQKVAKQLSDSNEFLGWKWGIGVGAGFGLGDDRVSEAEIVNGVVRVTKDVSNDPRIVLEVHNFVRDFEIGNREAGFGLFGAVNFGAAGDDTLTSFGGGVMLGIKRAEGPNSFNIGFGLMLDQGVKVLGDGFVENQPPPAMETEVRFREESQASVLVFISTTF